MCGGSCGPRAFGPGLRFMSNRYRMSFRAAKVIAGFTIVLALCGIVGARIAWLQWGALKAQVAQLERAVAAEIAGSQERSRETNESLSIAAKAADAALENAKAAKDTVDASINSERARFFFKEGAMQVLNPLHAPTPVFEWAFINYGRTTAILLEFSIEAGIEKLPLPAVPTYTPTRKLTAYNGIAADYWFGSIMGGLNMQQCKGATLSQADWKAVRWGNALSHQGIHQIPRRFRRHLCSEICIGQHFDQPTISGLHGCWV
jgi:hypothetical protein